MERVRADFLPHLQSGFPWHRPEVSHADIASAEEWWQQLSPVIAGARAGWKHVVLSNHVPELPLLVEALGLTPHIAQVFNSATLGYEKPHPKSFSSVLDAFPNAAHTIMVGDNYAADVQGAEAMGLSAILVRRPNANATAFHESLASLTLALVHASV